MARTRLRLGESLACMVYLHRWNCHKHLVFYIIALGFHEYFFTGKGDTRVGWDGREPEAGGHFRMTHCQGTLPGLGSRSKGFAKCRLVATNVFYSSFFLFTSEKWHYRPNSLSASTPPTSMCRILSQSRSDCRHKQWLWRHSTWLLLVTSNSNAVTRLISLYLKTLKNAHEGDWCRQGY